MAIPAGVKVAVNGTVVTVEGKAKLEMTLPALVSAEVVGNEVIVKCDNDTQEASAMHGLARSLVHNMVVGVSEGFKKELAIVGVGYRAQMQGSKLVLSLGFSHPVEYVVPQGVKVTVKEDKILIEGADKQAVGQAAATIRSFRAPEPYKGKGIRYVDEHITLKEGKTVG